MKVIILSILFVFCLSETCNKKPVVMIPGIMSSILDIKLNISQSNDHFEKKCKKVEDWDRLWASYKLASECYLEYMHLQWNEETKQMSDYEGVETRSPDFGKTYAIDTLWPEFPWKRVTGVWRTFISHLEEIGYKDGVDMMAAPYDWRYTQSNVIDIWMEHTKQLLIDSYKRNGKKAVLISSSMGGYMAYKLLDHLGKSFCDQYIDQWIAISMPVMGSGVAVKMITVGEDLLHLNLPVDRLLKVIRSIESVVGLLPIDTLWKKDDLLMEIESTGERYTVGNISQFIQSLPTTKEFGVYVYENTLKPYYEKNNYKVPNQVKMSCIISGGIETAASMSFKKSIDSLYTINYTDGDGMVNIDSLRACSIFTPNVTYIGKSSHNDILKKDECFAVVKPLICG